MFEVIKLPRLAQDMEEATIVAIPVGIGGQVKKGDIIFEIETDKAVVEMESPNSGFVKAIPVKQGDTVSVGAAIMILGPEDAQISEEIIVSLTAGCAKNDSAASREESYTEPVPGKSAPTDDAGTVASAFSAKSFTPGSEPAYKLGQKVPVNRLGRITAEKMLQSKRQIPCFYLNVTVNADKLIAHRAELNASAEVKISFNDFIMRAMACGLLKYPIMTGQLSGDVIKLADSIGTGLAVSTPAGLVAPIVKDVDKKDIHQVARYSRQLIERAKNGKLLPDDLTGGCITLSNLGAFGIDSFVPIVVPGQCSILGVGKITDTLVIDSDKPVTIKMMKMTLSVDHRVANGADAARFLDFVVRRLESPEEL